MRRFKEQNGVYPDSLWPALDKWEIPKDRVVLNRKLGEGAFGTVYGGEALIEDMWVAVAVKTLKVGSNTEEKVGQAFIIQYSIYRKVEC
jgi:Protein tyrosine and serine/threonine kinase